MIKAKMNHLIANSLLSVNPVLAREWHPTKNGSLTPRDVTPGSGKKVWWVCHKGHEWEATISSRNRGCGCPYCSGRFAFGDNCLEKVNPTLAKEWHPNKNGSLTPRDVTPNSGRKVWWLCQRGHEWKAAISNRSWGRGCPYCHSSTSQLELAIYCEMKYLFKDAQSRQKVYGAECDIFIPSLRVGIELDGMFWHMNKFEQDRRKHILLKEKGIILLRARERGLKRVSDMDVFFSDKDDYIVVAQQILNKLINNMEISGPLRQAIDLYLERKALANEKEYKQLSDMLPSPLPEFSLQAQEPGIAQEWHPTKNGNLTPRDVTPNSNRKVWWVCHKGHEWEATINNRHRGTGCPYCAGTVVCDDNCLKKVNPTLAQEWHPTKNRSLTPRDVAPNYSKKVWWICHKGHEWQATVNNRNRGRTCPYCTRRFVCGDNCLESVSPTLAQEWHPTKNGSLTPRDVTPNSGRKVWWLCQRGHEWKATVSHRSNGRGCPYCAGKLVCSDNCLQNLNPDLAKQWHPLRNGNLMPKDVTPGSGKKVWWVCHKGHEWEATISSRNRGCGCPYCSGRFAFGDNCLEKVNPTLAKEWHPNKNGSLTPRDVTPNSGRKVWWLCQRGHEWKAAISDRSRGSGCPYCAGKRR